MNAFTLDHIVPWGRSYAEYLRMFALTDEDLGGRILGCGDGPAAFNAEATRHGRDVVSCDPLYRCSAEDIRRRIAVTRDDVLAQTRLNQDAFLWTTFSDVDELGRARMSAMDAFLADYDAGLAEGRYIDASLPELPFPDARFDLALCSHLLFLYSVQLPASFHGQAVAELCRVATEVRIFPILSLAGTPSPHVEPVRAAAAAGLSSAIETVPYEFQRGGNQMLRLWRR